MERQRDAYTVSVWKWPGLPNSPQYLCGRCTETAEANANEPQPRWHKESEGDNTRAETIKCDQCGAKIQSKTLDEIAKENDALNAFAQGFMPKR